MVARDHKWGKICVPVTLRIQLKWIKSRDCSHWTGNQGPPADSGHRMSNVLKWPLTTVFTFSYPIANVLYWKIMLATTKTAPEYYFRFESAILENGRQWVIQTLRPSILPFHRKSTIGWMSHTFVVLNICVNQSRCNRGLEWDWGEYCKKGKRISGTLPPTLGLLP